MGGEGRTNPTPSPASSAASGHKHPQDAPIGSDLKRVAEIVTVLSGLGEMWAGWEPTVEKALKAEANRLLVGVYEGLNPKDLFSWDFDKGVVDELGLNWLMDPSQDGRLTKMSIADKLQLTKKWNAKNVPLGETVQSRLLQFFMMNKLKNKALRVRVDMPLKSCNLDTFGAGILCVIVVDYLDVDEAADIKEMFQKINVSNNRRITLEELKFGFHKLGFPVPDDDI